MNLPLTDSVVLRLGDCLTVMPALEANSFDSIVTDPPYGLSFMGKDWDHGIPGEHFWCEALRVAKPGAYLLAFGGTRTFHRLAVAIEDAGWEIRDTVMWVYGSGFPKSLDISKAIDKAAGVTRETGPIDPARAGRLVNQSGTYETDAGWSAGNRKVTIDPPATDAAKQWDGWGTALKPAWEPIIMARKPLGEATVAANVLKHGTGGINIDGCRVELNGDYKCAANGRPSQTGLDDGYDPEKANQPSAVGRWPANLIHDGNEEVIACFPNAGKGNGGKPYSYAGREYDNKDTSMFNGDKPQAPSNFNDSGSASRFFYCAKANKADREEGNSHPTVKPTALMRYLCRLVTPPGGVILDPFCGSGSTGKAARLEGFRFVGIEKKEQYLEIAKKRI